MSLSNAVSGGAAGVGAKGATKKIVSRGLEGCRLMSGGKVEMVALREVVNYEKMAQIVRLLSLLPITTDLLIPVTPSSIFRRLFRTSCKSTDDESERRTSPVQSLSHG